MSSPASAASEALATCHVVIGHPDRPAFLAVRHSSGWSPPTVKFPPGPVEFRAEMINRGVARKYGLHVRLLRPLVDTAQYHCLEMELLGRPGRRLDAVWVGREEYRRFGRAADGQPDPFASWLAERERGERPSLRPPWEFNGWFHEASHWMQFQLDRLQIQPTGSVEQFRAGSSSVCLLRIPTNSGGIVLRAAALRPPAEAPLTAVLAQRWPDRLVTPLAVEPDRNWMLLRENDTARLQPDGLAGQRQAGAALAGLQADSAQDISRWQNLGCPLHGSDYLRGLAADVAWLQPWLTAGGGRLEPAEVTSLSAALRARHRYIDRLADIGLPDTLVHADVHGAEIRLADRGPVFANWMDTVIGQPLFVLAPLLRDMQDARQQAAAEAFLRGHLDHLAERLSMPVERLDTSLELVQRLGDLWHLSRIGERLRWTEHEGTDFPRRVVLLQMVARRLIRDADAVRAPVA